MRIVDRTKLRPRAELIIALETLDFSWFKWEVKEVAKLWTDGHHIADIAKQMQRHKDEVAVLIMDLARKQKIRNRGRGVYGH